MATSFQAIVNRYHYELMKFPTYRSIWTKSARASSSTVEIVLPLCLSRPQGNQIPTGQQTSKK